MSRASIQAKADAKRGYTKDYAASAKKIEKKGGPKAPASTTKTSVGYETADQTAARAKAMLGSAYNPNTAAPSQSRLDEIANQSFITPENKAAYSASRPGGALPAQTQAVQTAYEGTGNAPAPAWATTPTANGSQPTTTQFSAPGSSSKAEPYYQQLLAALQSTGEERNVQNQQTQADQELRNLRRGQEQTNKNLADQPIAKPFITGQQAAVEQQYGIDRGAVSDRMQTLQAKLANLQAQRQSALDVAKTGFDYGKYQDTQAEKARQEQVAAQQYAQQQAQQQYLNTTGESRYADQQTQQALDNAYRQAQANKPSTQKQAPEDKETANFQKDAGTYIEQLGSDKISWGTAFNALKAKYPQASNELIDQTLGKERYYTTQGTGGSTRSI